MKSMTRIFEVLEQILRRIRENNPYGLVLKGGTGLAVHHIKDHRESQDLDFDVDLKYLGQADDIVKFIIEIIEGLVREKAIQSFKIGKKGLAATNSYHMNLTITTYKPFRTKVDLDFVELPVKLEYEGELGFYTVERMFVAKLLTFAARMELKDLYDISYLLRIVEPNTFDKPDKIAELIERVLGIIEDKALVSSYRKSFRDIDLRFRDLKESTITRFIEKTQRQLRIFRNELGKRI